MNQIFGGLGRFVVRFRFLVVMFWIVLAILSSKALPSMGSEVNNDNANFLSASAPSSKASTLAQPVVGGTTDDSQIFMVASRQAWP
jgi:uncharacterized membrane protein YdfJ with MMPL/SSD domain